MMNHFANVAGHLGPLEPPTDVRFDELFNHDIRDAVRAELGCSVSYRFRQQWGGKRIAVTGPPPNLLAAADRACELVRERQDAINKAANTAVATSAAATRGRRRL